MMKPPTKLLQAVTEILTERSFNETQIKNILPRLHENFLKEPKHLEHSIDCWNDLFGSTSNVGFDHNPNRRPSIASPPRKSLMGQFKINMNTILGDVEPDLLLLNPRKVEDRYTKIEKVGIANNMGEQWVILFNAPRGFYLQDWEDLSKKIYYIDSNIIPFLYDKKELKSTKVHPLIKSASVVEADFEHIRCRFMFASRSGYKSLSHLFDVSTALSKPSIKDLVMSEDPNYIKQFAPFCSLEEYDAFSDLIKKHDTDDDDAAVYEKLAELESLTHTNTN